MSDTSAATSPTTSFSYDTIPYHSNPIYKAQPARLAAAAILHGLTPPDVSTARVLELGCAAGGNLLPLGVSYPNAQFVGIDLSQRQIDDGQRRVAELELHNVELVQGDLSDVVSWGKTFDYILCHGVYSWVPGDVRERILQIMQHCLSPNGIAYLSYNALPGWHLKRVVRDAMLFHARTTTDPFERVKVAREMVSLLLSHAGEAYGDQIRREFDEALAAEEYFLTHDYLETDNVPFYFADIVSVAMRYELAYVTDADEMGTARELLSSDTIPVVDGLCENNRLAFEQYFDFFTNRVFRMSIFTHARHLPSITARAQRDALPKLWFQTVPLSLREPSANQPQLKETFATLDALGGEQSAAAGEYPIALRALKYLMSRSTSSPSTLNLAELLSILSTNTTSSANDESALLDLLFEMLERRMLSCYAYPLRCAEVSFKPTAGLVVRVDARQKRSSTTSLFHHKLQLTPIDHCIIPLLDGTRTSEEIIQLLDDQSVNWHEVLPERLAHYAKYQLLTA